MRPLRNIAIALGLGLLAAAPLAAQGPKDHGKGKGKGGNEHAAGRKASAPVADVEIKVIRDYYAGRARPKPLPPGIAKNLARGKPLPPGIAKTRVPNDLYRLLPPRPDHEWLLLGDVVVLVDPVGIVVDILDHIF